MTHLLDRVLWGAVTMTLALAVFVLASPVATEAARFHILRIG